MKFRLFSILAAAVFMTSCHDYENGLSDQEIHYQE